MKIYKTSRVHYVEVVKDIYAAITPPDGLDITDASMMDHFSNSAYIDHRPRLGWVMAVNSMIVKLKKQK